LTVGEGIPPRSDFSQEAAGPGNFKPESDVKRMFTLIDAEREHVSEVMEMTKGLIAGEGGAAEMLGVPPSTPSISHEKAWHQSSAVRFR
jgi:hypothetical protein